MEAEQEAKFKQDIAGVVQNHGLKGHAIFYLDGGRIKGSVDMELSSLAPMLLKSITKKFTE